MADAIELTGVKVTFLKGGVKNKVTGEYQDIGMGETSKGNPKWGVKGQWTDASGKVVKHLLWSNDELRADMCGKVWTGDITEFPPQNPTYQPSRWFSVTDTVPTKAPDAPPAAQAQAPSTISFEAREAAVRRLIREAYETTAGVFQDVWNDAKDKGELEAKAARSRLSGSFVEMWKCAIMSLKLDANVWPDLLQIERNRIAERDGMPTEEALPEVEAAPEPEPQPTPAEKLAEKTGGQVEAAPDDLEDCPF